MKIVNGKLQTEHYGQLTPEETPYVVRIVSKLDEFITAVSGNAVDDQQVRAFLQEHFSLYWEPTLPELQKLADEGRAILERLSNWR